MANRIFLGWNSLGHVPNRRSGTIHAKLSRLPFKMGLILPLWMFFSRCWSVSARPKSAPQANGKTCFRKPAFASWLSTRLDQYSTGWKPHQPDEPPDSREAPTTLPYLRRGPRALSFFKYGTPCLSSGVMGIHLDMWMPSCLPPL